VRPSPGAAISFIQATEHFPTARPPHLAAAGTSLSDLGIFHRKLGVLDHQNTVAENQNRSYFIYERRVF
jgi:hypothetical protein